MVTLKKIKKVATIVRRGQYSLAGAIALVFGLIEGIEGIGLIEAEHRRYFAVGALVRARLARDPEYAVGPISSM